MPYTNYLKKFKQPDFSQNTAYLELILTFIAVIFFGWFAVRPTLITITELIKEISTKQEVVDKLDQKIDALVAADTTYKAALGRLQLLEEGLPSDHRVPQFPSQVETLADEVGLQITELSFDAFALDKNQPVQTQGNKKKSSDTQSSTEGSDSPSWLELDYRLVAQGTYSQLREFVFQLYQLRRANLTTRLGFNPRSRGGEESSNLLNFQLEGQILYY